MEMAANRISDLAKTIADVGTADEKLCRFDHVTNQISKSINVSLKIKKNYNQFSISELTNPKWPKPCLSFRTSGSATSTRGTPRTGRDSKPSSGGSTETYSATPNSQRYSHCPYDEFLPNGHWQVNRLNTSDQI